MPKKILIIIVAILVSSCSTDDEIDLNYELKSDKIIYNEAMSLLKMKKYEEAHDIFTELDLQHPYSKWATKGQLMSGFSLYKANKYDEAIFVFEKFINLNPNNPNLDYAHYLRGFCYYERISQVSRDQKLAKKALDSFIELKNKFPNSKYSLKSKNHIALLNNQLAGKEMSIGMFYQSKGKYLSSILRYKSVLKNYKNSAQVPEAIYRIIESYLSLGLNKQALKLTKILKHNFPISNWYSSANELLQDNNIDYTTHTNKKNTNSLNLQSIDFDELILIN